MKTLGTLAIAAALIILALLVRPLLLGAGGSVPYPMPDELYKVQDFSPRTVVRGELKRSWIDWNSKMREVRIRRSERPGTSDPWPRPTTQTITTSFDISDVVAFCDAAQNVGTLWVAGTYETGLATIEKWTATAGGPGGAGAGAVTFVKTTIFQGDEMGSIASIAPDPQGRFVLVLGYESRSVYKLTIGLGGPPQVVHDVASIPELALAKSMVRSDHPVEGPNLLYEEPKRSWHVWTYGEDPTTILLGDEDDNGTIDSIEVLDRAAFEAAGYHLWSTWESPCFTHL